MYKDNKKFSASRVITDKESYKYDEVGNKIEYNNYDLKGGILYNVKYEYDFDYSGNWIKRIEYVNNVLLFVTTRDYVYHELSNEAKKINSTINASPLRNNKIKTEIPEDFIVFLKEFTSNIETQISLISDSFIQVDEYEVDSEKDRSSVSQEWRFYPIEYFVFGKIKKFEKMDDERYNEYYQWSVPELNKVTYYEGDVTLTFEKTENNWYLTKKYIHWRS
jgi:hypothetical protein